MLPISPKVAPSRHGIPMGFANPQAAAFARERLESVWITQQDYKYLVTALDHALTDEWVAGLLFWLDLCEEWSDEDFHQPDGFLELYREQADMQFRGEKYPLPYPRIESMTPEKMKSYYDLLITAHKIRTKFEKETGAELTDVTLAMAATLFIEDNKASRGGGGGYQRPPAPTAPVACPKCGGPMYDNSATKKNPKAPDYTCKDQNCKDPTTGYKTGVWKDRPPVSTPPAYQPPVQQQAPPPAQYQPPPSPFAVPAPSAQAAPFDDDLPF